MLQKVRVCLPLEYSTTQESGSHQFLLLPIPCRWINKNLLDENAVELALVILQASHQIQSKVILMQPL